ncbi:MAG: GNAT family N-acetyltransferase [Bacilli bacterium]|nr:GNAT family N-acetyltransferase [Bacilli bacterium]
MFSMKRVSSQEELNAILEVRKQVFVLGMNISKEDEIDEYDTFPSLCHHYAIMDDGVIVGTVRVLPIDDTTVRFQRFAVLESKRGKGLGRKAFEQLAEIYKDKNIWFHAMAYLENFYKSLGYLPRGPYFDECGIRHIEMYKNL